MRLIQAVALVDLWGGGITGLMLGRTSDIYPTIFRAPTQLLQASAGIASSLNCFLFQLLDSPLLDDGHLIVEASRLHSHTRRSVGLLWTSDQPDGETST
jgi:hypothetical protein